MGLLDFFKKPKYGYSPQEVEQKIRESLVLKQPTVPARDVNDPTPLSTSKLLAAVVSATPVAVKPSVSTARKPKTRSLLRPVNGTNEPNRFLVLDSFKLPPTFILNGRVVSGVIQKGMIGLLGQEPVVVRGVQEALQKTTRLWKDARGSLEVDARIGLEVPNGTIITFVWKKDIRRPRKTRRKKKTVRRKRARAETEITRPKKTVSASVPSDVPSSQ